MSQKTAKKEEKNNKDLITTYQTRIEELINKAVETKNLAIKPLLNEGALRINIMGTPSKTILFSIGKLSQRKAIVLTVEDFNTLINWLNEYEPHIKTILAVAQKYTIQKTTVEEEKFIL
jgi:hypothetical protein